MSLSTHFATPWGSGTVVVDGERLVEVRLPWVDERPATPQHVPSSAPDRADASGRTPEAVAARWAADLAAYFRGERWGWSAAEVHLESFGFTPFRAAVYRALMSVPAGETTTYGNLARAAGRPGAARAVGSAMAANPLALVIPCHRVVRSDGSLGHYEFGDAWKSFLLEHEASAR